TTQAVNSSSSQKLLTARPTKAPTRPIMAARPKAPVAICLSRIGPFEDPPQGVVAARSGQPLEIGVGLQRLGQSAAIVAARDLLGSESGQVVGQELGVEQPKATGDQTRHQ